MAAVNDTLNSVAAGDFLAFFKYIKGGFLMGMCSQSVCCMILVCIILFIPAALECVALGLSNSDSFYLACGHILGGVIILDIICNTTVLAGVMVVSCHVGYGIAVYCDALAGVYCLKVVCALIFLVKPAASVAVVGFSIASLCSPQCVAAMGDADGYVSFGASVLPVVGLVQGVIYLVLFVLCGCMLAFNTSFHSHAMDMYEKIVKEVEKTFEDGNRYGWIWWSKIIDRGEGVRGGGN